MTGTSITIEVSENPIRDGLGKLATRMGDLYPVLDTLGAAIAAETTQHFETGSDPDGNPWPVSMRAKLAGGQTLVDTGRLVQSITHQVSPDRQSVAIGTNVEYAAIHQFGGTIKPVNKQSLRFTLPDGTEVHAKHVVMPARPFIGLGVHEREAALDTIAHWLAETTQTAQAGSTL